MPSAANRPRFSILLVNYNTPRITETCLNLLRSYADETGTPVIVVNNSAPGEASTRYLETQDWVTLIHRAAVPGENGRMAHSGGLDLGMTRVETPHVLCIHTDTLIYDTGIFDVLETGMDESAAVVGCLDQVHRSPLRRSMRKLRRWRQRNWRMLLMRLGWPTMRLPGPESYVRSFCALWNVGAMRQHDLQFYNGDDNPGYAMQDALTELGFSVVTFPSSHIFQFLDHVQAGTPVEMANVKGNRRRNAYEAALRRTR